MSVRSQILLAQLMADPTILTNEELTVAMKDIAKTFAVVTATILALCGRVRQLEEDSDEQPH